MDKFISFKGNPGEIKALRTALSWTQNELATFLDLYICKKTTHHSLIGHWEHGRHRPSKPYVRMMKMLATWYRPEYLQALRRLK